LKSLRGGEKQQGTNNILGKSMMRNVMGEFVQVKVANDVLMKEI
jgi:hypothetical protein